MSNLKIAVENKLGCSIENFIKNESLFLKTHRSECERPNPFREFNKTEFDYLVNYCKQHNLVITRR